MRAPLDELYFEWLYSKVAVVELSHPSRTYWKILHELYDKEFVWFVPNDDNRIRDGIDLRFEFINEKNLQDADDTWLALGCSMLELMLGLSRRLSFEAEGEPKDWFWDLMENIGLEKYNDNTPFDKHEVDEILNRVIFRTYKRNGHGGFFPLRARRPRDNQCEVELWYQLNAYVLERD